MLGGDDGGESSLTYKWSTSGSSPGGTNFSGNNTNSAKNTVATFHQAGTYTFICTITDGGSLTTTSSVTVVVNQTLSSIKLTPNGGNVEVNALQAFSATGYDQFNQALAKQPSFTWAVTGGGSIGNDGRYTAPGAAGAATVVASSGPISGTATLNIQNKQPQVTKQATAQPIAGNSTQLQVTATDDGGSANLTYTWSVQNMPQGATAPTFSTNGNSASDQTTPTFYAAGNYGFRVTITDAGGLSTTSNVNVTVVQTPTAVVVSPANPILAAGGLQQFSAVVLDQFGNAIANPTITWSANGQGASFSSQTNGLYTASTTPGTYNVTAASSNVNGSTAVTVVNVPASALPNPVTGTTTTLSAAASGASYAWTVTGLPANATTPTFSVNNGAAAQSTVATFYQAGDYTFRVAVGGATTTYETVQVSVNQTLTSLTVTPSTASLYENGTATFSAAGVDQFGNTIAGAPQVAWGVSAGGGSISNNGLYAAPASPTTATVTATADNSNISASASVTVINAAPSISSSATVGGGTTVTGTTANLSIGASDDGGAANLTYAWGLSGNAPAPVAFSANRANGARNTTATFSAPGTYKFVVTVTDAGGLSTSSTVTVTVAQTLTSIGISPGTPTVAGNGTQQFAVTGYDQFGNTTTSPTVTWSAAPLGGGTFSGSRYTAPAAPFTDTVTATTSGGLQASTPVNVIATPAAAATPGTVTGTTTTLAALGFGNGHTYTWSATGVPSGAAAPTFGVNGSAAAQSTVATFRQAGNYTFQVAVSGNPTPYTVQVAVSQTLTGLTVSPASASLNESATAPFTAAGVDQFGNAIAAAPHVTWGVSAGGGSIANNGQYTAPLSPTNATVTATANGSSITASATVTVTNAAPSITAAASVGGGGTITGTTASLSVGAIDDGGPNNLTYTWSLTGSPPAPVSFSVNGTNGANSTTAAFTKAGTYQFLVTVADAGGLSTTSTVAVTVSPTLTRIAVSPGALSLLANGIQHLSAVGYDQFGAVLAAQPTFTWSVAGHNGGQVSPSGLYTAPSAAGTFTINAASGLVTGSAVATVVVVPAAASPNPVNGTTTTLSAVVSGLNYSWSAIAVPTGVRAPTFSNSAAANTVATFYAAGSYTFGVTIAGTTGTSLETVTVQVNQTLASLVVSPATGGLNENQSEKFGAVGYDQFGALDGPAAECHVERGVRRRGLFRARGPVCGPGRVDRRGHRGFQRHGGRDRDGASHQRAADRRPGRERGRRQPDGRREYRVSG